MRHWRFPSLTPRWLLAATSLLLVPALGFAAVETYKVDPAHSDVGFAIRHFVSKVSGRFDEVSGTITIDPKKPETLSFTGSIKAASINTHNDDRDKHLRSQDFFDVENHPEITFVSKKAKKVKDDVVEVTGDLTLRGVTKPVTLEVKILGFGPDAWGGYRAGFEASGKINRKDFGMEWNKALDQGGLVLGEDVEINLLIEAVKAKE